MQYMIINIDFAEIRISSKLNIRKYQINDEVYIPYRIVYGIF